MKNILKIIFVVIVIFISYGYYLNYSEVGQGEKFIGIGVLVFAFIFIPLFIYHRYNGKDLSRYSIQNMFKEMENNKRSNKRD